MNKQFNKKVGNATESILTNTGIPTDTLTTIKKTNPVEIEKKSFFEDLKNNAVEDDLLDSVINKTYNRMLERIVQVGGQPCRAPFLNFSISNDQDEIEPNKEESSKRKNLNTGLRTKKLKILVAEDDPASNYLLSIFLSEKSHYVIQVKNGQEALDACKKDDEIDLILMDIRMPILNGHSATKKIRLFNTEVIIIAQTAFGYSGDREKALAAGCNDYMRKPIEKEKLFEMINKYF